MRTWKDSIFAAAVAVLVPSAAGAWFSTGHMITAQIAYDELKPCVRYEVDRLIGVLADFTPKATSFVPAATWMDDIKVYGFKLFNEWHYYDEPINAAGLDDVAPPSSSDNVVWAIHQATATLIEGKAADFEKALALRFLIHFVGDVHQPLHCANRFTEEHPYGDRGGNDFALTCYEVDFTVDCPSEEPIAPTCIEELHALWDNTLDLYPAIEPLKNPSLAAECIPRFAADVTARVSKDDVPEWIDMAPARWANESHEAASAAYAGIEENALPSSDYLAAGQPIVRQRLALGGYRLGALLNCIFSQRHQSCLGSPFTESQRPH